MNDPAYPEGIFKPADGWEEQTWYLVETSCRYGNPVHRSLMFTGFLDREGDPAGYSGVFPANYAPDKGVSAVESYRYLKVIKKLNMDYDEE